MIASASWLRPWPASQRGLSGNRVRATQAITAPADPAVRARALSEVVPFDAQNPDPAQMLEPRWPLAALSDGDWTYIRREGEVSEEHQVAADHTGHRWASAESIRSHHTHYRMHVAPEYGEKPRGR